MDPPGVVANVRPWDDLDRFVELPDHASATSRAFGLPGHSPHMVRLYSGAINYRDENGKLAAIDTKLAPIDDGWTNVSNSFRLNFPRTLEAGTDVAFEEEGVTVRSTLAQHSVSTARAARGTVIYDDVLPEVDLEFESTTTGYIERLVLDSPQAPTTYNFHVEVDNGSLSQLPDGSIEILSTTGDRVAIMPPSFAHDSSSDELGEPAVTADVVTTMIPAGNGAYEISVQLSEEWFRAPERVFPVVIDPSMVKSTDPSSPGEGAPLLKDTYVKDGVAVANYNQPELHVGRTSTNVKSRSFLTFDIRQEISKVGSLVYKGEVKLTPFSTTGSAPVVTMHRITGHWDETTAHTTPPQFTPQEYASSSTCSGSPVCKQTFDAKSLVQWWLDNPEPQNPGELDSNHGITFQTSTSGSLRQYRSKEANNDEPYLEVVVNAPPDEPRLDSPTSGTVETLTPVLNIKDVSDPNGDDVMVRYEVLDANLNREWSSTWLEEDANQAIQVPAGELVGGKTYYWRVISGDVCSTAPWTDYIDPDGFEGTAGLCDDLGRGRPTSEIAPLIVDHNATGTDPRWALWDQSLGNDMQLSVNQANGNVVLEYPFVTLGADANPLSVSLSYNSQDHDPQYRMPEGWTLAAGPGGDPQQLPVGLDALMEPGTNEAYGVVITRRSGRKDVYLALGGPGTEVYSQIGPGAGVVRETEGGAGGNFDPEWVLETADGGRYVFNSQGALLKARPAYLRPGFGGFIYDHDTNASGYSVTDSFGRSVFVRYTTTSPQRVDQVEATGGRVWDLQYDASGRLTKIVDPEMSEVRFAYDAGGRLNRIWDGVTAPTNANETTITYQAVAGATEQLVTAVRLPATSNPWNFQYLNGFVGNRFSKETAVVDPRGVATAGDQTDFRTTTSFTTDGLPVQIVGPRVDQGATTLWPTRRMTWDGHGNLVCERSAAANARSDVPCVPPTTQDVAASDGRQTEYFYEDKRPYLLTKMVEPDPNDDPAPDSESRLVSRYEYDEGFAGLKTQYYDNAYLAGVPIAEKLSQGINESWGSGKPAEVPSVNNFSIRYVGELHVETPDGTPRPMKVRVVGSDNVRLILGDQVSPLPATSGCWSMERSAVVGDGTICPTELSAGAGGGWLPIAVEYQALGGDASVKLEWKDPSGSPNWTPVPATALRPRVNALSGKTLGTLANPSSFSTTDYDYVVGGLDERIRALPLVVSITGTRMDDAQLVSYSYDEMGRIETETDATGSPITDSYDPVTGCPTRTEDRVGLIITRTCYPEGWVQEEKTTVDGTERKTLYDYDELGRLEGTTLPDGGRVEQDYDDAGRVSEIRVKEDPTTWRITTLHRDVAGRVYEKVLPEVAVDCGISIRPTVSFLEFDDVGNFLRKRDQRGYEWGFTYDSRSMLRTKTDPLGDGWTFDYDAAGNLTRRTSPAASWIGFEHDILGRRLERSEGGLPPTRWRYDARGYPIETSDPDATFAIDGSPLTNYQERSYDALGRVVAERAPVGLNGAEHERTFDYDAAGYLTSSTNYRGAETDYTNDDMGRLTAVALPHPGPNVTEYGRNLAGEVVLYEVPRAEGGSIKWTFGRDQMGRVALETDANGGVWASHTYNLAGEETLNNRNGLHLRRDFDGYGNVVRTWRDVGGTVESEETFCYDAAGNMLRADGAKDASMQYDNAGRLKRVTAGSGSTRFDYEDGRLALKEDVSGVTTFGYLPSTDRIGSLADPASGGTTSFGYTPGGRLDWNQEPSGLRHDYDYDDAGRRSLDVVTRPSSGAEVAFFSTRWGPDSNVDGRVERFEGGPNNSFEYDYDGAGRLIGMYDQAQDVDWVYGYDPAHNRTTVQSTHGGTGAITRQVTAYDRRSLPLDSTTTLEMPGVAPTTTATVTYGHDAQHRLASVDDGVRKWSHVYDVYDRLSRAELRASVAGGAVQAKIVSYIYDALGRTHSKTRSPVGVSTVTSFDKTFDYAGLGHDPIKVETATESLTGTKVRTDTYAYLGEAPIATKSIIPVNGGTEIRRRVVGVNAHGDLAYLAGIDGTLKGSTTYTPWGEKRSQSGEGADLGFQGDFTDADTGMVDMGARLYAPDLGRFTTTDPVAGKPSNPASMNEYIYGWDDPLSTVDPDGRTVQSADWGKSHKCKPGCMNEPSPDRTYMRPFGPSSARGPSPYSRYDWTLAFIHRQMLTNASLDWVTEQRNGPYAALFIGMVRPGGPWDFKPQIARALLLDGPPPDYYFPARETPSEFYYDIWANIHYGYVGRARGMSRDVLLSGAAMDSRDDAADHITTEIGIHLWDSHGLDLTQDELQWGVVNAWDDLFMAPRTAGQDPFVLWENGQ